MPVGTFEALSLMISFGLLIIAILSFHDKGQK
ncbi:putative holin-like toxin [Oceanobacillus sp. J11TS1]